MSELLNAGYFAMSELLELLSLVYFATIALMVWVIFVCVKE